MSSLRNSRKAIGGKTLTKQQFVSMLNARRELKYNTVNNETVVGVNGDVVAMTQKISQGDSDSLRDGSQVEVVHVDFNLSLLLDPAATIDFVRFVIFTDTQGNGTNPAFTDVFIAGDPNASFTRNVKVIKRFKILHDVLLPLSIAGNSRVTVHRVKLKLNHVVNYLGTTDASTSNGKGAMYYAMCSDLASNQTSHNADWAISFYDS